MPGFSEQFITREKTMKTGERDYLNMLCDVSELAALLVGSENIGGFLQQTVGMVARHLKSDVCSIYLYEEETHEVVLKATIGLNPGAVGKVRMKLGEGLVGTALEKLELIVEESGSRNPKFKYFEEADEDRFESFLAMPIQRGVEKIGVLVVQHEQVDYFSEIDVMALRAIASQLAGAIENARLLMNIERHDEVHTTAEILENLRFVKGKSAVSGYALAPSVAVGWGRMNLHADDPESEEGGTVDDFYRAVYRTINQLRHLQGNVAERLPESASLIFTAHFMILKDESFISGIVRRIEDGEIPAEAVRSVARYYISVFSSSSHAYMREKVVDIEDLATRILANLRSEALEEPPAAGGCIVIAAELYPSDILKMASEEVRGIVLVSGGITAHVSILARSMHIPLIIADQPYLLNVPDGTPVLMDADVGNLYVNPSEKIIKQFESRNELKQSAESVADFVSDVTKTKDGVRIHLLANINLLSELPLADRLKAEGVGLYRTEFPFLIRSHFPSEEEQYLIYKKVFDTMTGKVVTIRTLDLAGDKVMPFLDAPKEPNPQLGLRSIRFTLENRDVFEQQLQAILRASADHENVRIMFPMISSIDEFRTARDIVFDSMHRLSRLNLPHNSQPEIGVLVELPSLVEIIDEIVSEADFISIGTNDFVQYMLAVDRTNEKVSDYYQPFHPSVLRSIAKIVRSVTTGGKDVYVCGEMAHEMDYIPFLVGVGVRVLSIDPQFMPAVQKCIADITVTDAETFSRELLSLVTVKDVKRILYRRGRKDATSPGRAGG